jgi:hypothetical protein
MILYYENIDSLHSKKGNKMTKSLRAAALSFIAITAAACSPAVQQAQTPTPLDDVRPSYAEEMQTAFNAYVDAHKLDTTAPLPRGLTIPWVATGRHDETSGYLVARGVLSEKSCQVFSAVRMENNGKYGTRYETELAMCASPVAARSQEGPSAR